MVNEKINKYSRQNLPNVERKLYFNLCKRKAYGHFSAKLSKILWSKVNQLHNKTLSNVSFVWRMHVENYRFYKTIHLLAISYAYYCLKWLRMVQIT